MRVNSMIKKKTEDLKTSFRRERSGDIERVVVRRARLTAQKAGSTDGEGDREHSSSAGASESKKTRYIGAIEGRDYNGGILPQATGKYIKKERAAIIGARRGRRAEKTKRPALGGV
jgi:hypothetical protein